MTPAQSWDHIQTLLERIPDTRIRDQYVGFHQAQRDNALRLPGSVRHHHAYPGGYAVHICEVMMNLKAVLGAVRRPPDMGFDATDSITASYGHDLDKLLYRYEPDVEEPSYAQKKLANDLGIRIEKDETKNTISAKIDAHKKKKPLDPDKLPRHKYRDGALEMEDGAIVAWLCAKHGLPLTEQALHAICVHHGGFSPLARVTKDLNVQPLGCFLHCADYISSNVQLGNIELPDESVPVKPSWPVGTLQAEGDDPRPDTPPPPPLPELFQ